MRFTLYPASYAELAATLGPFEARAELERRKVNEYSGRQVNTYFWRTYDQK